MRDGIRTSQGNWCAPRAIESLEARTLLSAAAQINFGPAAVASPAGYLVDSGQTFADRGNGFSYGWNGKRPAIVHQRHARRDGADIRFDTFALLEKQGRGSSWQIALPNGAYSVEVAAGAPGVGGRYSVIADGVTLIDGRAAGRNPWIDATRTVAVSDGLLTVTAGKHGSPTRLDFIRIIAAAAPTAAPVSGATPPSAGSGSGSPTPASPTPAPPVVTPPTPVPPTPTPPTPTPTPASFPSSLAWRAAASDPLPMLEGQSTVVNNKLYVFGGYGVDHPNFLATTHAYMLDPASNTWTRLADMPEPLTQMGVASDGAFIYVAGGYVTNYTTGWQTFGTRDVWRYDIAANTWSRFVSLPQPLAAGALVILGSELHYFDGVSPRRVTQTDHYVLDLSAPSPTWTASTPVPIGANHVDGVVLNGKIYAIGGQAGADDAAPVATVLAWDPLHPQTWQPVASLPLPLTHAQATAADGRIVVADGSTAGNVVVSSVETYDPSTGAWSASTSLPAVRLSPVIGFADGMLIVSAGDDQGLKGDTWVATI